MSDQNDGDQQKDPIVTQKQFEVGQVISSPENIGVNLDHEFIIDPIYFLDPEKAKKYLYEIGKKPPEALNQVLTARRQDQEAKVTALSGYLDTFQNKLKLVRLNPAGNLSPVSLSRAVQYVSDGSYQVQIAPQFLDQLNLVVKKVQDVTLVVPFYDHQRNDTLEESSDVPSGTRVEQYLTICNQIVEQIPKENRDRLQLEISNETNVSKSTNIRFQIEQHLDHVDPIQYAHFYYQIAKELKLKYPEVRLSIAGVACFDPDYLTQVLTKVDNLAQQDHVDTKLVDTISFHPYRSQPEEGSVEVSQASFTTTDQNYDQQMETMLNIGRQFDVAVTVGEINFNFEDPRRFKKLEQANQLTRDANIISYIYPGEHVH